MIALIPGSEIQDFAFTIRVGTVDRMEDDK